MHFGMRAEETQDLMTRGVDSNAGEGQILMMISNLDMGAARTSVMILQSLMIRDLVVGAEVTCQVRDRQAFMSLGLRTQDLMT
mmetsp:Transcript_152712/g.284481  ORF Transcript_152712/g.284481 Transcript_152712/m.284481 type:complete len:83 (+) Transcript_152712:298-546(+)